MNRQARRIVFKKWLDLLCASGRKHFRGSYRHIVQQSTLIFSPRAMNLQRGNSPRIGFFFIQLDVIFATGQALAESIKREHPWTGAAQHALEVRSKTRHPSASFPVLPRSPTLETVSTKQARMLLLDITEARNIDAVRAMPERNLIFVPRDKAGSSAAHTMIHQVVPKLAAGIGKPIGKFRGRGMQQNAGRLQRRSAEEQNTPSEFDSLPRLAVNNANASRFSSVGINDDAVYYAMRPERDFPCGLRSRKRRIQTTEIRARNAAARARPAIMASSAPAMPLGKNRRTANGHHPIARKALRDRVFNHQLSTRHLHRRQKFSIRKLRQSLRLARDSDEILDIVVPGRDVLIANRPVNGDSFAQVGFEIQITPAIRLSSPHDGSPAHMAAANPQERLTWIGGIRVLTIIDEELAIPFIHSTARLLNRLIVIEALAIAQTAESLLPDGNVLHVVRFRLNRAAS